METEKYDKFTAYCGLDCETCEARIATINDDNELRTKVAREWSEMNQTDISPEMINCAGCRVEGIKFAYCDSMCEIKKCALSKELETCGCCTEMRTCSKVNMIIGNNKEALSRLEGK